MSEEDSDGASCLDMPLLTAMVGAGDYAEGSADLDREVDEVLAASWEASRTRSEPPRPPRRSLYTVLEDYTESRDGRGGGDRAGNAEEAAGLELTDMSDEDGDGANCLKMPLLTAMVGVGDYSEGSADLDWEVDEALTASWETSRSRGCGRPHGSGRRARSEPPRPARRSLNTVLENSTAPRDGRGERTGQAEQAAGARAAEPDIQPVANMVFEEYQPRENPRPLVPNPIVIPEGVLDKKKRDQILSYYSGLRNEVYVCDSTAALFLDSKRDLRPTVTGAPVLVLEPPRSPNDANRIWLYIAEVGTGIPYFKEQLTYRTGYTRVTAQFYVFSPSWNHSSQAALSFKVPGPALQLSKNIDAYMLCLKNIGVPVIPEKPKKSAGCCGLKWPKRQKRPKKSTISTPCCFTHVITVKTGDRNRFLSLRLFTSAPSPTVTSPLVSGHPHYRTATRMNSHLRNGARSARYLETVQPPNVTTGQTTGRLRETVASRTAVNNSESHHFLGRNRILASTGTQAHGSGSPNSSWYNPFTDMNRQEFTSGSNDRAEDNRNMIAPKDPPNYESAIRAIEFDRSSNRDGRCSSTRSGFDVLPDSSRYPRESNPFNLPLTMEMGDTAQLPRFDTFARRSVAVNQPQPEIYNSIANPEAHSGPDHANQSIMFREIDEYNGINPVANPKTVSQTRNFTYHPEIRYSSVEAHSGPAFRPSNLSREPLVLTEIDEPNGIIPVASSEPFLQQSSPLHQPLSLTEYLSSIEVQARSLAISEPVHQTTPLNQPQITTYDNSFDATTSAQLEPSALSESVDFRLSTDSILKEIYEPFTELDSSNESLILEFLTPSDDQPLVVIRNSIDDQTLTEIRTPIDDQPLAGVRDYIGDVLPVNGGMTMHDLGFMPYRRRAQSTQALRTTPATRDQRVIDGGPSTLPTIDDNPSDSFELRPAILLNDRPGNLVAIEDPRLRSLRNMMDLAFPEGQRDDLFDSLAADASYFSNLPLPDPPRNSPEPPEEECRPNQGCIPKKGKQVMYYLRDP